MEQPCNFEILFGRPEFHDALTPEKVGRAEPEPHQNGPPPEQAYFHFYLCPPRPLREKEPSKKREIPSG